MVKLKYPFLLDFYSMPGKQRIYEEMKRSSSGEREFYSGSLVRLQIEFVKHRSPKLKDVIRFCKYWKKETQLNIPSYAIELIAIKVWEDQGSPDSKSLKDLITAVFTTMMQFRHLAVAWYANYNSSLCEPIKT
ncbi:hypothetical protein KUTeg_010365 [Tegillarca granosa]|uniref:2'-5'-oligoadenylate synthetase 1 domain-containing protein n=1 Tax=Tegillarca granosa TaxID=220873 RepID=A0ABQ9F9G3_TEGGR|nr:hypothetical protein KUTeg_010365 [Tegillarca granosa]